MPFVPPVTRTVRPVIGVNIGRILRGAGRWYGPPVTTSVDTAIVGAGIFGLATAHALCRDGAGTFPVFDGGMPGAGDSGRACSRVRRRDSKAVTARLAIAGARTIMR